MSTSKDVGHNDFLTTGKPYHPAKESMDSTAVTWLTVQAILKAEKNSKVKRGALTEQLKELHNHGSFVGYAIRRGWLVKTK